MSAAVPEGLGSAVLTEPQASSYGVLAETRELSQQEDWPQQPDSKSCLRCCLVAVLLSSAESAHHFGWCHNHSIVFPAEISWYQIHNKSKSLFVVSNKKWDSWSKPAIGLNPKGCSVGLGSTLWCPIWESQVKALPFTGGKDPNKATGVSFGWRGEQQSDGFLFNSYLSHSCCPPLIFVHGLKKMWWVSCVNVASAVLLELSASCGGYGGNMTWIRISRWDFTAICFAWWNLCPRKAFKMTVHKLRIYVTLIKQIYSSMSGK